MCEGQSKELITNPYIEELIMASNQTNKSPDALWWVLDNIQKDLNRMDEKWDENIAAMTRLTENLSTMSGKVQELNKLMVVDNGKPSVVSQLRSVTDDVKNIKGLVEGLKSDIEAVKQQTCAKTPKEVQVERLKTLGAIAGMIGLVIPGIISFVHYAF